MIGGDLVIVKEVESTQLDDLQKLESELGGELPPESIEEKPQETVELPYTVDDVVEFAGNLVVLVRFHLLNRKRKFTQEDEELFLERYRKTASVGLKLIGFDDALKHVPIKKLPPEQSFWIGIFILGALGFILPVGGEKVENINDIASQVKQPPKKQDVESKEFPPRANPEEPKVSKEDVKKSLEELKNLSIKVENGGGKSDVSDNG